MKIKAIVFLVLLLVIGVGIPQTSSGVEAYIFASDIIKSLDSFYRGEKLIYEKYQEGKTYTNIGEIKQDINIYRKGLTNAILLVKPYLNHKIQSIRFTAQKITSSYQQGLNLFDLVSDQMLKKPNEVKFITILDYENALKEVASEYDVGVGFLIHPLRLAVSGMSEGPGVFEILFIIGKEETLRRINSAVEKIKINLSEK